MGWFDEQIKQRKEKDEEAFEESFERLAGSILGHRIRTAFDDDKRIAKDALGEILKFYHMKAGEIPDEIKDVDEQREYLFRPYGIMRRAVILGEKWHRDAVGALLGIKKSDGSLVALIPDKITGYRYFDRETGKYVKINSRNEKLFEKEAFCFYRQFPLKELSLKSLFRYLLESLNISDWVLFGAAALAATLIGMFMPRLNNAIFSSIVVDGNLQTVLAMTVFLLSVSFAKLTMESVKTLMMTRIQTKMDLSVESVVMMRILSLPADFFKDYSAGELAKRSEYIGGLCDALVASLFDMGLTALFSLVYVAQIFNYAPALVVPALCVIVLMTVFTMVSALVQMRITKRQMEFEAKESGMSYALISGIQKIRLSGSEKRAFSRWARLYAEEARLQYNPPLFLKLNSVINTVITLVGAFVIQYMAVQSAVSVAGYYAFNTAYGLVSGAFLSLSSVALTIANVKPVMEMARPIMEAKPEAAEGKQTVSRITGGIELNNVSFRYDEKMPWVLDNLTLKIRPGQYVAIAGTTGCGKSTLMRLMLGFEKPQKGAVYYDGKDMETIDLKSLRRKIGVVMQDGKLFQGDIYSNIVISAPRLTVDEAWEAAEMAGMADDIRNMPMGMQTLISEGSGGISGGQRQRIMIARAIAPKPRILMFDEATSALDNITQKTVSDSLARLKCTRIVIAHRLSTIRQCDRIIVLDKGKIVEDGTYEELLEQDGFFAKLVERQRVE